MRSKQEIDQEYTMTCAHLGINELKRAKVLEQLDAERKALLDKVAALQAEADKVAEVQTELEKQKAEAAKGPVASEVSNEQTQTQ